MPEYLCFCGKVSNPEYDPYGIPHSCGDTCGKKRGKFCIHSCTLTCHPGPCPPCNLPGREFPCYCGAAQTRIRCSDENPGFSCGAPCNKTLLCGKHKCPSNCHDGPCPKCDVQVESTCYCGKKTESRNCGKEIFSCENTCEKKLDCQNHTCKQICHNGDCQPCPYTPEKLTNCCCGRMTASSLGFGNRKSCLDPIPVCGLPCTKILPCGHPCKKTCHPYECGQCKELVIQTCRCKKSDRKIECWKTVNGTEEEKHFLCDRICRKLKSCKTHKCQNVCCDATKGNDPEGYHLCLKVCGKPISCKRHTCEDFCHLGDCKPCPVIINHTLSCACGKTTKNPPLQCGASPPECSYPCSRKRSCKHECHLKCHYDDCPPCGELIEKPCFCGKKIMKNIKCHKEAICGNPCDTQLPCGHKCGIICHIGECDINRGLTGCGTKCGKIKNCQHKCEMPCHPDNPCPQDNCKVLVKINCECGNKETLVKCSEKDSAKLDCDKSCANMKRFGTFLKAVESKKPYYPPKLVRFAKSNLSYLRSVEDKLEKMFKEGKDTIEIQLYDKSHEKRAALHTLISKHYSMDLEFYSHQKNPSFCVKSTQNSKLPAMPLSEYLLQVETGKIKPDVLPFEATLKFFNLTLADTSEELEYLLKAYEGEYYVERSENKQLLLHFWRKDIAEEVLGYLKKTFTNFSQAVMEENISLKAEEEKAKQIEEEATHGSKKIAELDKKEDENKDAFLFLSLNNN